jgi:predicted ArsR family transcriptional regulator
MSENGMLTSRQEQFVQCLLAGNTITVAASICKVSGRTASRWHKDPAIKQRLNEAKRESYALVVDGLIALVSDAIDELARVLHDKKAGHAIRLRAIEMILSHSHMHMVDMEVDERLSQLESALEEHGQ